MSSDMSSSGSLGLSDWALVNVQGEFEVSDGDSSSGSLELISMDDADVDCTAHFQDPSHTDSLSSDAIELEELMKKTDEEAAKVRGGEGELMLECANLSSSCSVADGLEGNSVLSQPVAGELCPEKGADNTVCEARATELGQSSFDAVQAVDGQEEETCVDFQPHEPSEEKLCEPAGAKLAGDTCTNVEHQEGCENTKTHSTFSKHLEVLDSDSSLSVQGSANGLSLSRPADSDTDSDFVRLDKDSICGNASESDEDAASHLCEDAMHGSVSSVGSGFNFLAESCAAQNQSSAQSRSAARALLPPVVPLTMPPTALQQLPAPPGVPSNNIQEDDADTESSMEQSQDDRAESEQSDDANSFHDDQDQDLSVTGDIADLPLENGRVERHYVHHINKQLNVKLNRVVLTVMLIALGLGLGHWIGSTREYFSQMTIQLDQTQRLHKVQDEYVQCLSRNDELLLFIDQALETERSRHQEVLADLHDNNLELQEQLQAAQVELEKLLVHKMGAPFLSQLPFTDGGKRMVLSDLLFASEDIFQRKTARMGAELQSQLLQARAMIANHETDARRVSGEEASQDLSSADEDMLKLRQHINLLEEENLELKMIIGRQRYQQHPGNHPASESLVPLTLSPDVLDAVTVEIPDEGGAVFLQGLPSDKSIEQDGTDPKDVGSSAGISLEDSGWLKATADSGHTEPATHEATADSGHADAVTHARMSSQLFPDSDAANIQMVACGVSSPRTIPVDVSLLQRNLTLERQRSQMWRRLYLLQRRENSQARSSTTEFNSTSCLHFIQQSIKTSALLSIFSHFNVSGNSMDDFTNLTFLMSSISQMHQNLLQSLPAFWDHVSNSLFNQSDVPDPSEKDGTETSGRGSGTQDKSTDLTNTGKQKSEPVKRFWSDSVQNLLNRTKTTMSNVRGQLKQTWDRVRDASASLWPHGDSIFSRVAARVKEGVTRFSKKVHDKASKWFDKREKKYQKAKNKYLQVDINENKETKEELSSKSNPKGHHDNVKHGKSTVTYRSDVKNNHAHDSTAKIKKPATLEGKMNAKSSKKHHDGNFKHRKSMVIDPAKPRSSNIHQDGEIHFDSQDQVFHSQRSAEKAKRKLVKRFDKLCHRVGSMSQRRFAVLDDDDMEEMIEDFQKIVDEHRKTGIKLSESGMTSLHCQLAWWKRARHGEFTASGDCWQYLAAWQNEMLEAGTQRHTSNTAEDQRQVSPKGKREENGRKNGADGKYTQERKERKLEPVHLPEENSSLAGGDWFVGQAQHQSLESESGEGLAVHERQAWYIERSKGRDHQRQEDHRADWVFDRAFNRDASRQAEQNSGWLFERAAMREDARLKMAEDPEKEISRKFHKASDHHQNYRQRYGRKAEEKQCC